MSPTLTGTEELTLEIPGSLPREKAATLAGDLEVEHARGATPVSLLVFRMVGLAADDAPAGPGASYAEALWRVAVVFRNAPAWLVIACDVETAFVRKTAGWLVRYPVRPAAFTFEGSLARGSMSIEAKGKRLAIMSIPGTSEPPPDEVRPMLVRSSASLFEIPWSTEAAPFRRIARVAFAAEDLSEATFGPAITWATEGRIHQGRVQHSGIAVRV